MARANRPAGPPPGRSALHEAALRHLARFTATEAGLVRVLERRIRRWAEAAAADGGEPAAEEVAARKAALEVARALVAVGAIDDGAFARARAGRLSRGGRSRRAVAAHLASKGVGPEVVEAALPDEAAEHLAALAYARRRRIGPFRAGEGDAARELAAMGRAGFSRGVAERALRCGLADAEAELLARRR